jgi:hypothetical protein
MTWPEAFSGVEPRCISCRFWRGVRDDPDPWMGPCVRHTPVAGAGRTDSLRVWPQTYADDSCGDFVAVSVRTPGGGER